MAITIDPGRGALSEALTNLGQGLARRVFEKQNREEDLRNSGRIQDLVPAFEAAVTQGDEAVDALANTLGVRRDFVLSGAAGFDPSAMQRIQDAQARSIESTVEAEEAAGIHGKRVEGEVASIDRTVAEAGVATEVANELIKVKFPELNAQALAAGAKFDAKNANFQSGLIDYNIENGIARAQLDTERARALLTNEAMQGIKDFMASVPENDPRRVVLLAGLSGSGAENAIASMRNADLAAFMRQWELGRPRSEEEVVGFTLEMSKRYNEAVDRLVDLKGKTGDKDIIGQAEQDVENMFFLISDLVEKDVMLPIGIHRPEGRPGKARLNLVGVESTEVQGILRDAEEMFETAEMTPERMRELLPHLTAGLTTREREQVMERISPLFETQRPPFSLDEMVARLDHILRIGPENQWRPRSKGPDGPGPSRKFATSEGTPGR